MIQVFFLTKADIAKAGNKVGRLHAFFRGDSEKEAVVDFGNCLKKRLRQGTAIDFLNACDKAAEDLSSPEKVPETYDRASVGIMRSMAPFFAEKLFSKSFAEEVKQFLDLREMV